MTIHKYNVSKLICQYTSTLQTYPNVFIQQVEYSTQYRQKDDCINDNQWAYTVPASKNYIVDFNISDVCFNLQTQRWQFEVNNNNILHVRNILQICDKPQILDDFSQLPPGYSCEELMKDLDAMEKREIHNYLFRDLLWWHEYQHIKESENSLSKFRNDFVERLEELVFDFECSDFPDPLEASLIAKERYEKTLKEYYIKSMLDVPIYTDKITEDERKKLELQLNSNILGVIDAYRYNAKMNYCN